MLYSEHLAGVASRLSAGGKCAADALRSTLAAAVEQGEALEPTAVTATWRQMAGAETTDAEFIINHWQLGYGRDDAPVISIGTEHAYELMPRLRDSVPTDVGLAEITMECVAAVLWLCLSRPDVLQTIAAAPWWRWAHGFSASRPYHIYTGDYYKVAPRSTWPTIGRDVLRGGAEWRTRLAERCYQIELSGYPALQAIGGKEPTQSRIQFLESVVREMAPTARVLIFHGTPKFSDIDPRNSIGAAFLGAEALGNPTQTGQDSGRRQWKVFDRADHRVIFTRALSGLSVSREYLGQISQLVGEVSSAAV